MIELISHIKAIELWIALAGITAFLYGPWQKIMIDLARHKLFLIRDDVFLLATNDKLNFDSDEYKAIREELNFRIRYCHKVKWISLLIYQKFDNSKEQPKGLIYQIKKVRDDEVRENLYKKAIESYLIILLLIFARSPLLLTLSPFIILYKYIINQNPVDGSKKVDRQIERNIQMERILEKYVPAN